MAEYELEIIPLEEKNQVKNILNKVPEHDIYTHPNYLKLFQDYTRNKAIYVYYGNKKDFILIPYFERSVNFFGYDDSDYIDLVSPWYYGGPCYNVNNKKLLKEMFSNFIERFGEYCKNNKVITEFQRLNPLLKNHELYKNGSKIFYDRDIVYIDLTKNLENINKEYTKHTRKNIKKAKINGLGVYPDESKKSISKFIKIYSESMKKKNAKDYYYFNETFFENLFKKFKGEVRLFNVEYNGKVICSSIVLGIHNILHDYLRGVNSDYLHLRPNDILIDEIIKWAKSSNYQYFCLQGGVSSSDDDGIFRFKKSFSSTTSKFFTYRKIHNLDEYIKLCGINEKKQIDLKYENSKFFPEYAR
ncbi:GNAT family N-acetyltransferase [Candidatus Pacearchaeota archaeon]|nr:GNAT family N-acetyltransferase [Candidatus Pacearchaeota archaeon]